MTKAIIYVGSGQVLFTFPGWKVRLPFNGYKANMQAKTKAPSRKPRNNSRRRRNKKKSESANSAEGTATPIEEINNERREEEVQSRSPSSGSTDAPEA